MTGYCTYLEAIMFNAFIKSINSMSKYKKGYNLLRGEARRHHVDHSYHYYRSVNSF